MTDEHEDIETMVEQLYNNLTAIAEQTGAKESADSDGMKALKAALSGHDPSVAKTEDSPADALGEQFLESLELSVAVADAVGVPPGKIDGPDAEAGKLATVAKALDGGADRTSQEAATQTGEKMSSLDDVASTIGGDA